MGNLATRITPLMIAPTSPEMDVEVLKVNKCSIDELSSHFGNISLCESNGLIKSSKIVDFSQITQPMENVCIKARFTSSRDLPKMSFMLLRSNHVTIQAIVKKKDLLNFVTKNLTKESIVLVQGNVVKAKEPVKSCSITEYEFIVSRVYNVGAVYETEDSLKYKDVAVPENEDENISPSLHKRLNYRVLDLRTPFNHAVFKSVSHISQMMRKYLLDNDFFEIYTPKIIGAASEGGSDVFKLKYFENDAYLAQSPQLYKQMALCADFNRIFTVGPVFRAENSNTHRHLCEFTGFDMEMTIKEHYHEVIYMIDGLFRAMFDGFFKDPKCQQHVKTMEEYLGRKIEFAYPPIGSPVKIFHYREALELLKGNGIELEPFDDINTTNEKLLGEIIFKKFGTNYYVIDKFPLANRAFYTMEDTDELGSGYSNSYDFFIRGEEVLSGAQRISDGKALTEAISKRGIDVNMLESYVSAISAGVETHGGGGIGLERVLMFMMDLRNIRRTSLFPRDPQRLSP